MDTQATLSKLWRRGESHCDLILRLAEIEASLRWAMVATAYSAI